MQIRTVQLFAYIFLYLIANGVSTFYQMYHAIFM